MLCQVIFHTPDKDVVVFDLGYVRTLTYEKLLLIKKYYLSRLTWKTKKHNNFSNLNCEQVETFSEKEMLIKSVIGFCTFKSCDITSVF